MNKFITDLGFGKVWFKDNLLIAELNEGILFDVENNKILLELGQKKFMNRPYGYISHRINSYAVNPLVYRESANTPNLKAIAVVTTNETGRQNAILERQFYKNSNSFEVFTTLDEAFIWMKKQI